MFFEQCKINMSNLILKKIRDLERKLVKEHNYEKWKILAQKIDKFSERIKWKSKTNSKLYDYKHVKSVIQQLKSLLERKFLYFLT